MCDKILQTGNGRTLTCNFPDCKIGTAVYNNNPTGCNHIISSI